MSETKKPTPRQLQILRWMHRAGGRLQILAGYRRTILHREAQVRTMWQVRRSLQQHGWIKVLAAGPDVGKCELTPAGRKAANG